MHKWRKGTLNLPIFGNFDLLINVNRRFLEYSIHVNDEFQHHTRVVVALTTFDIEFPQETLLELIPVHSGYLDDRVQEF